MGGIDIEEGVMPSVGPAGDMSSQDRRRFEQAMQRKLELVDYVCRLTGAQKRKLQLAGRGDVKHLVDEARVLRSQPRMADRNPNQAIARIADAEIRPWQVPDADATDNSSIVDKLLTTDLTPEQAARYAGVRDIARRKGEIHLRVQGAGKELQRHLEIVLSGTGLVDEELAHISTLPNVSDLRLSSTRVTDAGLAHLEKMTGLCKLHLDGCGGITDAGMTHLRPLANLGFLHLDNTRVGDAGLAQLKGLKNVNYLFMNDTQVTNAGMVSLGGMSGLYLLQLDRTDIGDAGLESLHRLMNLRELHLFGTRVTDAGLQHLKRLPRLRALALSGKRITDAGLAELHGMVTLWELVLDQTAVTDRGVVEVERALPYVRVIRDIR